MKSFHDSPSGFDTWSTRPIIVAIVGEYPAEPTVIRNGVEAVVVNLVEGLRHLPDVNLTVVSVTNEGSPRMASETKGVTIHRVPATRRLRNVSLDFVTRLRVGHKLDELRPDIVHVHNHAVYPFMRPGMPPYPTVTTVHGIIREEVKYELGRWDWIRARSRRLLERVVLGGATDVIAVSDYARDVVASMSRAHITVIDNPVAERFFEVGATRPAEEQSYGRSSILVVGALTRRKNILDLLRALEVIAPPGQRPAMRLAGSTPDSAYYNTLRQYVCDHSLDSEVTFLGQLSEAELVREYERCTFVASASREETAGMMFQQAMAARVAVVGTRVGGVPFVVQHGVSGLLAQPGDIGALASAMQLLLSRPDARAQFGAAGREIALRRFTPVVAAERTMVVYRELLQRVASESVWPST